MNEQDLFRIVRDMLSSIVDLLDSSVDEKTTPAVLLNVRNGAAGFVSLLDEVIIYGAADEAAELEDVTEDDK